MQKKTYCLANIVFDISLGFEGIINDTDPFVLPEQAYVVTQILEGIYTSAKTGKPFYFDN